MDNLAHKPRGRPRHSDSEPNNGQVKSRRAQQNREAALRYRARKDERIRELENQVVALQLEVSQLRAKLAGQGISHNTDSTAPVVAALPALGLCTESQQQYYQQQQYQQHQQPDYQEQQLIDDQDLFQQPNAFQSFESVSSNDQNSEQYFVDPPQLLATRFSLKALQSLQNEAGIYVDRMLNLFLVNRLVQILKNKDLMLAACSPDDKVRALEILEHCKISNRKQMIILYESQEYPLETMKDTSLFYELNADQRHDVQLLMENLGPLYTQEVAAFRKAIEISAPSIKQEGGISDVYLDELCQLFMVKIVQ
ncbi:hypothetical protein HK100_011167 [Physocladia obscura]|uniref:BZIP domain-containing protein n=1 Tax=Physocladia obscura TaxID=109957 RepID=A0AAD5T9H2_9FUNG|nr:hypothetical protein HK100_011167 [Physocladia obscura]